MSAAGRSRSGPSPDPLPDGAAGEVYLRAPRRRRRAQAVATRPSVAANPGGSAAILGVRAFRLSGVQGLTTLWGALVQMATLFAIALFLGSSELGRYGLLFFLAMMLGQILVIPCKPGIIRRVFGGSDDEDGGDDEDEEDSDVADSPLRTLGVGLIWSAALGVIGTGIVVALREPIAELLLNDPRDAHLIVWSGVLGGSTAFVRTASIVLWFERRPVAFLVAEGLRPALALGGSLGLLIAGEGLAGAIAGAALGTLLGALVDMALLRGSFELALDLRETGRIALRGAPRIPVMTSLWAIQNADVFILSRFIDDSQLGVYLLASRLGFIASFLPQGFRMAMRPLRKAAVFAAAKDQYGKAVQRGEYLGYFVMLCISTVLLTTLVGELLVQILPATFGEAGGLIPATALGVVGPALLRTVNQSASWPGKKRRVFITSVVGAALVFVGATVALVGAIGVYAAPAGLVAAFGIPSLGIFLRCQLGPDPIAFPYSWVARALGSALAVGGVFYLLPALPAIAEIAAAIVLGLGYLGLLVATGAIPEKHRRPLAHVARSLVSGSADTTDLPSGVATLGPAERDLLRRAVGHEIPAPELAGATGAHAAGLLRRVARTGGARIAGASRLDAQIAAFVFSDRPRAVRDQAMRGLFSQGASSHELRALEDLAGTLAEAPAATWEVEQVASGAGEGGVASEAAWRFDEGEGPARITVLVGADDTGFELIGEMLIQGSLLGRSASGPAIDALVGALDSYAAGHEGAAATIARIRSDWTGETLGVDAASELRRLVHEPRLERSLARFEAEAEMDARAAERLLGDLLAPEHVELDGPGIVIGVTSEVASVPAILRIAPSARVVHLLRDGRDVLAEAGPGAELGAVLDDWASRVERIERGLVEADSPRTLTISLDELTRNRRPLIYGRLLEFLDLPDEVPVRTFFRQQMLAHALEAGTWRERVSDGRRGELERRYDALLDDLGDELRGIRILRRVDEAGAV